MEYVELIEKYFYIGYLVTFMSAAYVFKNILNNILESLIKKRIAKFHASIFIIGSLVAIPFWFNGYDRMILFQTYLLGTAIHSHLVNYLLLYIKKKGENL